MTSQLRKLVAAPVLVVACSAETTELRGEPIPILLAELAPGCFSPPPELEAPPFGSDVVGTEFLQRSARLEFMTSYAAAATEETTRPIRAAPEQRRWVSRHEDAELRAWVVGASPEGEYAIRTEVRVDLAGEVLGASISTRADLTRYALDEASDPIVVHPYGFSFGPVRRGCDPATATSFDVKPVILPDGTVGMAPICWRRGPGGAVERLDAEAECREIADRVVPNE